MSLAIIRGIRLAGVASAVPAASQPISEAGALFGADDVEKVSKSTGVERRHLSSGKLVTSDLCYSAAHRLLAELKWEPASVDALVFVSQTCDFPGIPATSCVLQNRLGLSTECAGFDVGLGCSGYVYGLWVAASLLAASRFSRALVLVGDVINRVCSPQDRSTALLFGDAGSATALEQDASAQPMTFCLGTDGSGWKNLVIPAGGLRLPRNPGTAVRAKAEGGNLRSPEDLFMDGGEVFAFTLREVPALVEKVLKAAGWSTGEVEYFLFHQANKFMLSHLAKFMKVPLVKVPLSLQDFGNTSSASIPLTINARLPEVLRSRSARLLLAGFGVGYSWAGCTMSCGPIVVPEVILVEESEAWPC